MAAHISMQASKLIVRLLWHAWEVYKKAKNASGFSLLQLLVQATLTPSPICVYPLCNNHPPNPYKQPHRRMHRGGYGKDQCHEAEQVLLYDELTPSLSTHIPRF